MSAQITFQSAIGGANEDFGHSVQQTNDGGFIISGGTKSFGAGDFDVYLVKTGPHGNITWTRTFGGLNGEYGFCLHQTSDNGFIIAGKYDSASFNSKHFFLVKTDSLGNPSWSKSIESIGPAEAISVKQTSDGGFIIAGHIFSGLQDAFIIKADANGNATWSRTYRVTSNSGSAQDVRQTSDGGYIFVGTIMNNTSLGDVYLVKTDSSGNVTWSKTFGGANGDAGTFVLQTSDGGYIITAGTRSFGAGSMDAYIIKTDSEGNPSWTKTYGGNLDDIAYSVEQNADSGYIITGFCKTSGTKSDVYIIKTNAFGDTLWTRTYGGNESDWGQSLWKTTDGGYVIAGSTYSYGKGNADLYLLKTDSNGNTWGCQQGQFQTIIGIPPTNIGIPVIVVNSCVTSSFAHYGTGSGGDISPICSSVEISEVTNEDSFIIYPNPATDVVNVKLCHEFIGASIQIFNIFGQKVYESIVNQQLSTLHLDNSPGIYFLKVIDGNKTIAEKFIIQ